MFILLFLIFGWLIIAFVIALLNAFLKGTMQMSDTGVKTVDAIIFIIMIIMFISAL